MESVRVQVDREAGAADVTIPTGCPACEGRVVVRVMQGRAWSVCPTCQRLSSARVQVTPQGLVLHQSVLVA